MKLFALSAAAAAAVALAASPWDPKYTAQAQALLNQMNLTEKLFMVRGYGGGYVGDVPANTRLNIPPLNLEDGPQGVADGVTKVTAWPSALTVVQSWDPAMMYAFGRAMGQEQFIKGTNVMLGPGVNLARVPWGGRNFEYQGEDPHLASIMVAAEVQGIQSQNISGCVKHYVNNNQEYNRGTVSANVPERANRELYYKPFAAAVDAGVGSAMCSYNRINNTYACENPQTLSALKDYMGFKGWVMSDWGATHSTVPAAVGGLDQQMPDGSFFGDALAAAVANGTVPESRIDDMVMRMLVPMYALGLFANPPTANRNLNANALSDEHNQLARQLAEASITLLKNDGGILPISKYALPTKSVVIIGDQSTVTGHGSGGVTTPYVSTPFEAIFNYLNGPLPPRPVNCTYYNNTDFYQPSNPCVSANDQYDCCAKCSASDGCNAFAFVASSTCAVAPGKTAHKESAAAGACWLKPDASGQKVANGIVAGICAPQPVPAGGQYNVTYYSGNDVNGAAAAAAAADIAIVNVATTSSEGSDRSDLSLGNNQDQLVAAIAAAQKNTVVIVRSPGPCFMPWKDSVPAILFQLMPGQESGNALTSALFGDVNPSGKLPVTFPNAMNETWLSPPGGGAVIPTSYPGTDRGKGWLEADYVEELLIGYRWYDAQSLTPLFPFGHGLSYTTFGYTSLQVTGSVSSTSTATVSFTLTNTGSVAGAEVAQLYLGYPAAANEPPKQLRGFQKTSLVPGESTIITLPLAAADVQIWDVTQGGWTIVPGTYTVMVGSSSRDIRLNGSVTVSQ